MAGLWRYHGIFANDSNNHQGHSESYYGSYSNCGGQGGGGSGLGSASHALNFNHQVRLVMVLMNRVRLFQ